MRSSIFAAAAFMVGAFAAPALETREAALEAREAALAAREAALEPRTSTCLTIDNAYQLAYSFKDLINLPFNKTLAISSMVPTFVDYASGVNTLIDSGCPNGPLDVTAATFTSRKAFIAGQSGQPPIPFDILNVWWNCDTITFRWRSNNPGTVSPEIPVTGIVVLETVPNTRAGAEFPYKIQTTYSEFNSGAWLYDLGIFVPSCS